MSKNILITGASGFIGRHLLKHLNTHHSSLYNLQTVSLKKTPIENLTLDGVHTIIHCAALVHQMKGAPADAYLQTNTVMTIQLAEKAKLAGVNHFVFISSAHVYGEYGDLNNHAKKFSETSPCHPIDPYAVSKFAAEDGLRKMQDSTFTVSIIRPPMVYGAELKGNLVTLINAVKLLPILPFANFNNHRSIIHVINLAHFIHLVMQHNQSGIYLPQDEAPVSIGKLVELIANGLNKKIYLFKLPEFIFKFLCFARPNIMTRLYGTLALDSSHSNEVLKYRPIYSSLQGIAETVIAKVNLTENL